MPKGESADALLKRLQKIERAQERLGEITARIRAQAETLGELLKVAQGFVDEQAAAKSAGRARSAPPARTAAAKRGTTKRSAPKAGSRATVKRSTASRTAAPSKAGATATPRAASRTAASRRGGSG